MEYKVSMIFVWEIYKIYKNNSSIKSWDFEFSIFDFYFIESRVFLFIVSYIIKRWKFVKSEKVRGGFLIFFSGDCFVLS